MPSPSIRVLIAEDYEPYRRFVSSTVQGISTTFSTLEVGDGQEAVQKAKEFQPELILLDIGLPSLNGIEAAKQIREFSPQSRILFVTMESSAEMVEGALATGAAGYLVKADAARELVLAIEAVLRGEKYLSNRLASRAKGNGSKQPAVLTGSQSPLPQTEARQAHSHEIEFYSNDSSLFDRIAGFAGSALRNGNAAVVIATEAHREEFLARLQSSGLDMKTAIEEGRYVALDALQALSNFVVDGRPDPTRYRQMAVDLITSTAKSVNGDCSRVCAYGECASLLWESGNAEGALQVEILCDEIGRFHGVPMLCGYRRNSSEGEERSEALARLCGHHTAVISR
jgi:DNA-binding NarL/FixJ family response regulator